ncbi:MAG: hypothetical protein ACJATW_000334 [Glaciecola sp.]|jgi:hypothetical protein
MAGQLPLKNLQPIPQATAAKGNSCKLAHSTKLTLARYFFTCFLG